jgi:ribonuclease BN (tRNA processing enzyme)
MRLVLLGTQGWVPTATRETTCFAVEDGDQLLLFDAGTGLGRLVAPPWRALAERCRRVHLFLTHFHLDHVCGLAYLPAVFPQRPVVIHAPTATLTGVDPLAALDGLVRPPYNPRPWRKLDGVTFSELGDGLNEVAGHRLRLRLQTHSDPSVAYRLDDALVVATDTVPDPATTAFAAGARVLLHEAWYLEPEAAVDGARGDATAGAPLPAGYAAHSGALAVARLARAGDVGRLVFIHLNPLHGEADHAAMAAAAREVFAAAEVRPDGDTIDLAGPYGGET